MVNLMFIHNRQSSSLFVCILFLCGAVGCLAWAMRYHRRDWKPFYGIVVCLCGMTYFAIGHDEGGLVYVLALGSGLSSFLIWKLLPLCLSGVPLHFSRGLIVSILISPIVATPLSQITYWLGNRSHLAGHLRMIYKDCDYLICCIFPFWVIGIVIALLSSYGENRSNKKKYILIALSLLAANYQVSGMLNPIVIARQHEVTVGHRAAMLYYLLSRPGSSRLRYTSEVTLTSGHTLLHFCARNYGGNSHIAAMLIKAGANVNAQESYGRTPLHIACQFRNLECIKLLVENGAYINHVIWIGDEPMTPLDLLFDNTGLELGEYGQEIVEYLKANGAKRGTTRNP